MTRAFPRKIPGGETLALLYAHTVQLSGGDVSTT